MFLHLWGHLATVPRRMPHAEDVLSTGASIMSLIAIFLKSKAIVLEDLNVLNIIFVSQTFLNI